MRFWIGFFTFVYLAHGYTDLAFAAGGTSSGGGEFITSEENPWFIGESPVRYCIQIENTGFSVSSKIIKARLAEVFSTWKQTVNFLKPIPTTSNILDGNPKNLTTQFIEERCQPSTEIVFAFGTHAAEIQEILKQHARFTIAFAKQISMNEKTGRAKGIVWLAADKGKNIFQGPKSGTDFWSAGAALYNVLSHELGHVYGFNHSEADSGIMWANIPLWSVVGGSKSRYSTQGIIMQHWLRSNVPVCGWLQFDKASYLEELFSLPYEDRLRACFRKVSGTQFRLEIMRDTTLLKAVEVTLHKKWIGNDLVSVGGNYSAKVTGSEGYDWPIHHSFVSGSASDHQADIEIGSSKIQMLMQTSAKSIRFTSLSTSDSTVHYFEIIFPQFE
ncbi:MAG: matrixin family metalloprotease [Pseudobdellovibrionaceae bacterium]